MTVHTICDRCGMEYDHAGVTVGSQIFCCLGCANGTGCTCLGASAVVAPGATTVVPGDTVVVSGGTPTVVSGGDDAVIIR